MDRDWRTLSRRALPWWEGARVLACLTREGQHREIRLLGGGRASGRAGPHVSRECVSSVRVFRACVVRCAACLCLSAVVRSLRSSSRVARRVCSCYARAVDREVAERSLNQHEIVSVVSVKYRFIDPRGGRGPTRDPREPQWRTAGDRLRARRALTRHATPPRERDTTPLRSRSIGYAHTTPSYRTAGGPCWI